eukprot:symbB.v1.2.040824.t2/scaffold7292.1/size12094/3
MHAPLRKDLQFIFFNGNKMQQADGEIREFKRWTMKSAVAQSELSEVARHVGSSDDLAREVQAIIDELRLDDPLTDSSSSSSLRQSRTQALTQTAPPIPRATALEEKRPFVAQDSNYMLVAQTCA